MAHCTVGLI